MRKKYKCNRSGNHPKGTALTIAIAMTKKHHGQNHNYFNKQQPIPNVHQVCVSTVNLHDESVVICFACRLEKSPTVRPSLREQGRPRTHGQGTWDMPKALRQWSEKRGPHADPTQQGWTSTNHSHGVRTKSFAQRAAQIGTLKVVDSSSLQTLLFYHPTQDQTPKPPPTKSTFAEAHTVLR